MRRFLQHKAVVMICRTILGLVFISAALGKIANPQEFADAVFAFRILPITWTNIFAITLPWVELLVGLALLTGTQARQAATLSIILNAIFIIAASSAMARGLDIKCGCFTLSKAHASVGWSLLARDLLFIGLAVPLSCSSVPAKVSRQTEVSSVASD